MQNLGVSFRGGRVYLTPETLDEIQALAKRHFGTDILLHSPLTIPQYEDVRLGLRAHGETDLLPAPLAPLPESPSDDLTETRAIFVDSIENLAERPTTKNKGRPKTD